MSNTFQASQIHVQYTHFNTLHLQAHMLNTPCTQVYYSTLIFFSRSHARRLSWCISRLQLTTPIIQLNGKDAFTAYHTYPHFKHICFFFIQYLCLLLLPGNTCQINQIHRLKPYEHINNNKKMINIPLLIGFPNIILNDLAQIYLITQEKRNDATRVNS